MIIMNSVRINAAADAMWKWEQSGRTDEVLRDAAAKDVMSYCEQHQCPPAIAHMLLDAIQITVRIANGFPPNTGVMDYGDEEEPQPPEPAP